MSYRIVSLVPSLTELVVDLGLSAQLVGRTGFCIHPRTVVASIPKVGGTKTVNIGRIRALEPTHVLVNVDENRLEDVEQLRQFVPHVVVTHPCGPHDNVVLVDQMAALFGAAPGVREAAAVLRASLARELAALEQAAGTPQEVLYLIWRDPWMTVAQDTYISRMLALAGWHTLPAVTGGEHGAARYPVVDWAQPWLARVGRVLLPGEPYAFTAEDAAQVRRLLPHAQVLHVDGELISWYGSRAVAGLQYLRELASQLTS